MQYTNTLPARSKRVRTTVNTRVATRDPAQLIYAYLQYIEHNERRAKNTVDSRRSLLNLYIGYLKYQGISDIYDITQIDVDEYIERRSHELKESSLGQLKTTLRSFYYYCEFRRKLEIQVDYAMIKRKRDKPPKVKTYTFEEIQRVIANADNYQDKLMIAVLFESGVRIGELVKICVDDINGTEIRVRGKGSYDRTVYITSETAQAIRRHIIECRIRTGEVFRHQINFTYLPTDVYKPGTARERIQRQFIRAGFLKMWPHQLRHSFAINYLANGGDLRTLQKLLGHSSLEVTQRYLQITDRFTEKAYKRTIKNSVLS